MTMSVIVPLADLSGFSLKFQAEFTEYLLAKMNLSTDDAEVADPIQMDDSEQPADLSVAQINRFLARVSDKVRTTLRVIAETDQSGFEVRRVMQVLGVNDAGGLRGVWGGITKRVRTVLGDEEAHLIWWIEQDHGWEGRVSPVTHRALRKAFGII